MTASVRLAPPPVTAVQGRRAGVVTRTAASVLDAVVVLTAVLIAYGFTIAVIFLWSPRQFRAPSPRFVVFLLAAGVLLTAYLTVCWTVTGRTYGDRILAVRVVDRRGDVPSLGTAGLRAVFCVVVPLGLFWTAINRNNRSLQDVLLRTSVIYDWEVTRSKLPQPLQVTNEFNLTAPSPMPRQLPSTSHTATDAVRNSPAS